MAIYCDLCATLRKLPSDLIFFYFPLLLSHLACHIMWPLLSFHFTIRSFEFYGAFRKKIDQISFDSAHKVLLLICRKQFTAICQRDNISNSTVIHLHAWAQLVLKISVQIAVNHLNLSNLITHHVASCHIQLMVKFLEK